MNSDERLKERINMLLSKGRSVDDSAHWAGDTDYGWQQGEALVVNLAQFTGWRDQVIHLLRSTLGQDAYYTTSFVSVTAKNLAASLNAGLNILNAVQEDLKDGYLSSVIESAHLDVFTDFLDMADHLIAENPKLKDPAAVLAGGVLEGHLKKLCEKHGVPTTETKGGVAVAKKAQRLNDDLAGAGHLSKNDQKSVTAWLAIRNDAAHVNYDNYTKDQVAFLIMQIRDFVSRYSA